MAVKETKATDQLRESPMMAHLLDALDAHEDIGHYGQLVFTMVARFFLSEGELVKYLQKNPGVSEEDARALVEQVATKGYKPPKRDRIIEWQQEQDFEICPDSADPDHCDVYKYLKFPDQVYQNITEYAKQKMNS